MRIIWINFEKSFMIFECYPRKKKKKKVSFFLSHSLFISLTSFLKVLRRERKKKKKTGVKEFSKETKFVWFRLMTKTTTTKKQSSLVPITHYRHPFCPVLWEVSYVTWPPRKSTVSQKKKKTIELFEIMKIVWLTLGESNHT